jgi:hypothetical protein
VAGATLDFSGAARETPPTWRAPYDGARPLHTITQSPQR